MGGIVKAIGNVIGAVLGTGSSPKANSQAATSQVDTAASKARDARSRLIETSSAGDALEPGEVQKTDTIFGN